MLDVGIARWVSKLSQVIEYMLDAMPPSSTFSWIDHMCEKCSECVARELPVLLKALFKYAYRESWKKTLDYESIDSISNINVCLRKVAACDPKTSLILCNDLERVTVNKIFDEIVKEFVKEVTQLISA